MDKYLLEDKATAAKLIDWLNANGRSVAADLHIVDCREHPDLRAIVAAYGPGWESSDGLSWKVHRVDQLVNVYIKQEVSNA